MHPDLAITPHPGFLAELPSRAGHLLTGLGYEGSMKVCQNAGKLMEQLLPRGKPAKVQRRCLVRRCDSQLVHFHIHDDDQFHEQPLIAILRSGLRATSPVS